MYYPCSENKGADQLCAYREAGLHLCFRICKLLVFLCGGSIVIVGYVGYHKTPQDDRMAPPGTFAPISSILNNFINFVLIAVNRIDHLDMLVEQTLSVYLQYLHVILFVSNPVGVIVMYLSLAFRRHFEFKINMVKYDQNQQ